MFEINFEKINPCGGSCDDCINKKSSECEGCRETKGKCVKLWNNGCQIYKCCEEHNAYFCGVCDKFPCEWIINKIGEWDKNGIEKLKILKTEYREMKKFETMQLKHQPEKGIKKQTTLK